MHEEGDKLSDISLIYSINKSGPKRKPWGTLCFIILKSTLPYNYYNIQTDSYLKIYGNNEQFYVYPSI